MISSCTYKYLVWTCVLAPWVMWVAYSQYKNSFRKTFLEGILGDDLTQIDRADKQGIYQYQIHFNLLSVRITMFLVVYKAENS